MGRRRVVIIGGGFGGLACARALDGVDLEVTLVDRRNHHLFQPLLYQVATAGLAPSDIAWPIRGILTRQKNVTVLLDEVSGVDLDARRVITSARSLPFDYRYWLPAPGMPTSGMRTGSRMLRD